ncbi:MAG: SHOCT domain-containing protein [Caulobacterales bacterium]|nr:SHOCT domain-containing protein [Caulobacterales bacterium]
MTKLEALERLARLKDAGALTDEEFASEKAKILARDDEPPAPALTGMSADPVQSAPLTSEPAASPFTSVTSPRTAIDLASRAWASVVGLIAGSVVGGVASIAAIGGGRAPILMSGTEGAIVLGVMFVVNTTLVILFGWLTARRHSLVGAWLLLLSSASSLIFVLADDPMQDGLYVLVGLVAFSGMATWYAGQALRGVLALRRFSRQPGGREAINSAKAKVEQERASQPRPTAREALAIGMETSRPIRRVITGVGLMMMAGVLLVGGLFWWLHLREPRTAMDLAVEQQRVEQAARASVGEPQAAALTPAETLQASDLIGVWLSEGEFQAGGSCDEGLEMSFAADGSYHDFGNSGTWSLVGSTLTLDLQEWEGFAGEGEPPFYQRRLTVTRASSDRLLLQEAFQPAYGIVRCGS